MMKIEIKKRPLKTNRHVPAIVGLRNDGDNTVEVNSVRLEVQGLSDPRQPIYRGKLEPGSVKYLTIPLIPEPGAREYSLKIDVVFTERNAEPVLISDTATFQLEGIALSKPGKKVGSKTGIDALPDIKRKPVEKPRREKQEPGVVHNTELESKASDISVPEHKPKEPGSTPKKEVEQEKKELTREDKIRTSFTDEAADLLDL